MKRLLNIILLFLISSPAFSQELDLSQFKNMSPRNIGPSGMSGRVTSIDAVNSDPSIIYVGTASGGLWKTTSGGINWEPIFDKQDRQSIGAVAIDQSNPDVIWAGTGEGNPRNSHNSGGGIYRSLDAGKTWMLMGLENTKTIHRIIIHRENPDIVFVAALGSAWGANPERGVYRTTDGGETWEKVLYVNDLTGAADLVVDPTNPNKLIAAMWEYERKPWTFNSGGEGSGIYISVDGGDTWKKRDDRHGLPEGDLGRIGLAIASSDPNIVYALVEAKVNALYKSTNGGWDWSKVSDKNIGNRPFYYADIYVDPWNENRIYNLYSVTSMSEDGGKTFKVIMPYNKVHPDHHAFWINPNNPDMLINGNDGGLAISHDRGAHWRFIENLPLAQFYHINYDMDIPYNIMGGMQDNGSWVGPSSIWEYGGLRNHHWQEVLFGDGFDVMPDPANSDYGYAMYQGGNVYRYNRQTGETKNIKPIHPNGDELRFNWNAAMAQEPFNDCTIFFGSQYVHKSIDCGQSWKIISPDLTTNDTSKQKQHLSGGLTIDNTRAENHTTLLCITPSTQDAKVIWTGSDDGLVHVTTDGGLSWINVSPKIKGLPEGCWIPQIEASPHDAGTAFVVANNYRRNNWSAYLFKTTDYGKTWTRLVDDSDKTGFCLSVVQDPVVPELLFLGTDQGLYFSLNGGANWQQWDEGFPAVSVVDLKIHPREHDLIIGTFGRSAWIMDDIRPLREISKSNGLLSSDLSILSSTDAYLAQYKPAKGVRFTADAHFVGPNKSTGSIISVWLKPPAASEDNGEGEKKEEKNEKIHLYVLGAGGDTLRHETFKADTGLNRITWDIHKDGIRWPDWDDPEPDGDIPRGIPVRPGTYDIIVSYKGNSDESQVEVKMDPRINYTNEEWTLFEKSSEQLEAMIIAITESFNRLKESRKVLDIVKENASNLPKADQDSLNKEIKSLDKAITELQEKVLQPKDYKGINRTPEELINSVYDAVSYIWWSDGMPGPLAGIAISQLEAEVKEYLTQVNEFYDNTWTPFREDVEQIEFKLFKDYKPIEIITE